MVYSLLGCFIPLRNKKREIISYVFVDEDLYDDLKDKKWYLTNHYVFSTNYGRMHRYLTNPPDNLIVDHINNNPCDNRLCNLRITTQKENTMNMKKYLKTCSSKYKGVHFHKLLKKYRAKCGKFIIGNYEKEEHAAWVYDEYCRKNFSHAILNNISKPCDFIQFECNLRKDYNEKNVYRTKSGKWGVHIKRTYYGLFTIKEDAIKCRDNVLKSKVLNKVVISRNSDDIAIRTIIKNNKEYIVLLDDNVFIELQNKSLHLNLDGYPLTSEKQILSRYVINAKPGDIVDHINNNRLDNRLINLRVVTLKENAYNKKKQENTSSKYIGVYYSVNRKKWYSHISVNGKLIHLGSYENENDAAKVRDEATNKYFGIYGKLNFTK